MALLTTKALTLIGRSRLNTLLLLFVSGHAVPNQSDVLRLLQASPEVQIETQKIFESHATLAESQAGWLPKFTTTTEGGKVIGGNATNATSRSMTASDEYIDLVVNGRQLVFDFGSLNAQIRSNEHAIQAQVFGARAAQDTFLAQLTTQWAERSSLQRGVRLQQELINQLKKIKTIADRRFAAGSGTLQDSRALQLRLLDAEAYLVTITDRLTNLDNRILTSYGTPMETFESIGDWLRKRLNTLALQNLKNPRPAALLQLEAQNAQSILLVSAEAQSQYPTFFLELESRAFNVDSGVGTTEHTANVILDFNLFDAGASDARVAALSYRLRTIELQTIQETQLSQIESEEQRLVLAQHKTTSFELENQINSVQSQIDSTEKLSTETGASLLNLARLYESMAELRNREGEQLSRLLSAKAKLMALHSLWETILPLDELLRP